MLVQVWSDIGDIHSSPDTNRTPLIILPPIFKMAPGELRSLRLVLSSRDNLPTDRESVFWLNLYQIPPENLATQDVSRKLILPLRLRLKVFIRPAGLKVPTEKDEQRLHFSATSHGVMITNPTPWYMSLVIMTSIDKRRQHNIMLAPYEKNYLDLPQSVVEGTKIDYAVINDSGNWRVYSTTLTN